MNSLKTIFISNNLIECYTLKGRLETDGINCFLFDEHIISVHPFRAVTVGGVKVKVLNQHYKTAKIIMQIINQEQPIHNELDFVSVFYDSIEKQNQLLKLKSKIIAIGNTDSIIKPEWLNIYEFNELIKEMKIFLKQKNKKMDFSWEQFWFELFDFDRSIFSYFRFRTNEYYLENDLISKLKEKESISSDSFCPNCNSANINYGFAFDCKLDLPYLLLSLIFYSPFPPFRKNYFCFDCRKSFKNPQK